MSKFLGRKYVPKYQEDYNKLPCFERDLINYFNDLKYKEMIEDPNDYFKNKKVINFDIILHESRGDSLQNASKSYKTIEKNDFNNYPKNDEKKVLDAVFRNKKDDLWLRRYLMINHFK